MPAAPIINLADLTKVFRSSDAPAVDRLSLAVEEAETVVLVGPSGCGKMTTLKMIDQLIDHLQARSLLPGVM